MVETLDFTISPTTKSRVNEQDITNVPFGKVFSDHMFVAEYIDGKWSKAYIQPYGDIPVSPAMSALHYGQAIFEGMKAYKNEKGEISLFRPLKNHARLNLSANRMAMPEIPEDLFMSGLIELLKVDAAWIPATDDGSLYIRPFMVATEDAIGVRPSERYKFMIITCPVGKYYAEPVKVLIEQSYFRSVVGGVGYIKTAGNYGRSLHPTKLAQDKGFQQVIWTDARTHEFVEESGTMNLMFVIDNTLVTPELTDTILAGITRDSVLTLAKSWGMKVEERKISVLEIIEAHKAGKLQEAFGTGTAATIAQIIAIGYKDELYSLPPVEGRKVSTRIDADLKLIRKGKAEDPFQWMTKIN